MRPHLTSFVFRKQNKGLGRSGLSSLLLTSFNLALSITRTNSSFNGLTSRSLLCCLLRQHSAPSELESLDHFIGPSVPIVRRTSFQGSHLGRNPYLIRVSAESPLFCGDGLIASSGRACRRSRYRSRFHPNQTG